MDIYKQAKQITDQQGFNNFLKELIVDFKESPNGWENDQLLSFLEGLQGYCLDKSTGEASWRIFAEILLAARVYE